MKTQNALEEEFVIEDGVPQRVPRYSGLRMTAAEYERLEDDGCQYELIDGLVVLSPSATVGHQLIRGEVVRQFRNFLDDHPVGEVVGGIDVTFDPLRVYRPDVIFLSVERFPEPTDRVHVVPDMILEVLSPGTRALDLNTKRDDYQRFGVTEYWIVDPSAATFTFLRLGPEKRAARGSGGDRASARGYVKMVYHTVPCKGSKFPSKAVAGFSLDLAPVKRLMVKRKK